MNTNKEILRTVTSEQLKEYINDPVKKEQVANELIKMAQFFINKNNLNGIDREDYLHDLFLEVWKRIDKFDDKRGSFSTFSYWWFKSYVGTYIRSLQNQPRFVSLDMETVADGSMLVSDSIADEAEITFADEAEYKELFEMAEPELQMWSKGVGQEEIAKRVGITQAQVSRRIAANIKRIREKVGLNEDGTVKQ
jgi:RNA polymerase sigma factor (sigma-70 family)